MRKRIVGVLAALVLVHLLLCGRALAAPESSPPAFKLRVMSFTQATLELIADVNSLTTAGGSLEIEFLELYSIEAGGSVAYPLVMPGSWEAFLRGGLAWTAADWQDADQSGWALQLDALVGYRYLMFSDMYDGDYAHEWNHCVQVVAAIDATYWGGPHAGFSLRLGTGLTAPFYQTQDPWWTSGGLFNNRDSRLFFDAHLMIGLALR